ncbi:SPOR domain-containing protein [Roseovarius pelagicus]|uniref:SPOR domain-containing protein n=1 Tax=Roseovarius pelagicus TaxID=2980108 RepID=A0ABY6DB31_9RHOB|nr:SPOR domain-containing protein [Roseovarius pelagicus]UXX83369.1 SPOR domain-containing protein [Roseovarius pelagicus]
MAEIYADRHPDWGASETSGSFSKITYVLGSLVSIGLIVGLGLWGYKLLVRDVSGVPVIRAAEGPIRVQPENPGGEQALNQGLSVNDVAAVGAAGQTPDQLILAPAPLDLSDEDAPSTWASTQSDQMVQQAATQAPEKEPTAVPMDDAGMLALADALADGVEPLGEVAPPREAEDEEEALQTQIKVVKGGIGTSLRPKARPVTLSRVETVAAIDDLAGPRDIDPDTIAPGTRLAQLGAFKTEEIAREEWTRLAGKFEDYLTGKDRVIQRATSGGRTFYRLRAMGFEDLGDARRFCSALVAEKAECIPVVTR